MLSPVNQIFVIKLSTRMSRVVSNVLTVQTKLIVGAFSFHRQRAFPLAVCSHGVQLAHTKSLVKCLLPISEVILFHCHVVKLYRTRKLFREKYVAGR